MPTLAKNPIQNHLIGYPCMLEKLVCRIIGEADGCLWEEINGNRLPSVIKICTPHGTVITTGRFYVDEISIDGLKKLMDYESELIDSGKEVYGGYLNNVLEELNIISKKSNSEKEYFISNEEIAQKTKNFSGNLDTMYGYESGWQHARDFYENKITNPKNKLFIDDYKFFEVNKNPGSLSRENAEFIWSLMPMWIKHIPKGLDPTFYGTLSKDGDEEISSKVKNILFGKTTNKSVAEENKTETESIKMTETEKSFMDEIDRFLYWSGGNVNVLEIFRKHKKMPD